MSRQHPCGQDEYWSCVVRRITCRKLNSPRFHGIDVLIVGKPILGLRDKVASLDPALANSLQLTFYHTAEVRQRFNLRKRLGKEIIPLLPHMCCVLGE